MAYKAVFGIDGGVSHGFGSKYPDYIEKKESISAESPKDAMLKAVGQAVYLSREHLSNPKTDRTTVKILALLDSDGGRLSQEELGRDLGVKVEEGCAVVSCTMLEHFLMIKSRE